MVVKNFSLLREEDTVKFVCGSEQDLERAGEIIRTHGLLGRCHIYLSPVFGAIQPVALVEYLQRERLNGVRVQLQLHKFIWDPEKRGV
jgi:7-carboxy-7-deazaguanine synthase